MTAVTTAIRTKRANDRAAKRAASARMREAQKAAAAKLREDADERIWPAIQRTGVTHHVVDPETGRHVEEIAYAPRLKRDGMAFVRSDPLQYMALKGSTITVAHLAAAERLRLLWDRVGEGVGLGASDWGRIRTTRGTAPAIPVGHEALLAQVAAQVELEAVCAFLGSAWPVIQCVALRGQTVGSWAAQVGMNPQAAVGFLAAALDRLVDCYVDRRPERRGRMQSIEIRSPDRKE